MTQPVSLAAIEEARRLRPDVVVLNIAMPVLGGFEAAHQIKKDLPETAIVILSTHADKWFVERAKEIGVQGYVSKPNASETLVKTVEEAVKSEDFVVLE